MVRYKAGAALVVHDAPGCQDQVPPPKQACTGRVNLSRDHVSTVFLIGYMAPEKKDIAVWQRAARGEKGKSLAVSALLNQSK